MELLPGEMILLCMTYLLPEEVLMCRQVNRLWREYIPSSAVMTNDDIRVGSLVCYRYKYRGPDFPMWGSDVGHVINICGRRMTVQGSNGSIVHRSCSSVRRIRVFPAPIAVHSRNGFVKCCPGCHSSHQFSPYNCLRLRDCTISINKVKIDPFPGGFVQVNH